MRERLAPMARLLCYVLAAVLLLEVVHALVQANPLRGVSIPQLPTLPKTADPPEARTNAAPKHAKPGAAPELPAPVQARASRVAESEILGPFMRPLPLALLGIAGDDAFLRAPDGQTGLVREGGEVGGVKLLRIGTNRVLVEQDGEKKELTLFSGLGGEPLLPPATNSATTNKSSAKKESP